MRALRLDSANMPFRQVEMARPVPDTGQVLVRIMASGVNPLDLKIRSASAPHARHPLPGILGMDLAGVVEQVGPGVAAFKQGDEVYGLTGGVGGLQGSLAEFAAVDADLLAQKPASLDMRDAAAVPLVFITAWEGLVDRANVQAGQKVLVHGAGGVGHVAIQLARARGAQVFASASAAKRQLIEQLGATAIDYRQDTVEGYVRDHTNGRGFDIVYDSVGGATLDASFNAVRRFGHVVSALGWGTHALAPLSFRAATYSGVFTLLPMLTGEGRKHHGDILREAAKLVDTGQVKPMLDPHRYSLGSVADAYLAIEQRRSAGKVVIDIAN
jgi:NADPH:quinone reductase-like Zn-dependent oxidoreductase